MSTHITNNSGNQEHYTPSRFTDSARKVMGSIDLDPASNFIANSWIKASKIYTIENQGLDKEWSGNVWMNPPYDSKSLKPLVDKIISSESIKSAIVLCNNNTDTKVGQKLLNWCTAICLVAGRVKFMKPDGTENKTPLQGQIIYYKGSETSKFMQEFTKHGAVFLKGVI